MAWMTSLNAIIRGDVEIPPKTTFECSPDEAKQLDALNAVRPATEAEIKAVKPDFGQPELDLKGKGK